MSVCLCPTQWAFSYTCPFLNWSLNKPLPLLYVWSDWTVFIFCCAALAMIISGGFAWNVFILLFGKYVDSAAWLSCLSLPLQMFSVIPRKFLPGIKNPCWYEDYTGNITSDPYRTNLYARYSKRFRTVFQHLRNTFREHLFHRDGKLYRMRCLPYFYIIGQPKCGTTDLYDRLRLHPDIKFTIFKEPHWWTRKRFGE